MNFTAVHLVVWLFQLAKFSVALGITDPFGLATTNGLFSERQTGIQLYNIPGQFPGYIISSYVQVTGHKTEQSNFWLNSTGVLIKSGEEEFTERRTSLHPLSLMRMATWVCHPPPPSIVLMSICNHASRSCAHRSFPLSCA